MEFDIGFVIQFVMYGLSVGAIYGGVKAQIKSLEEKVNKHNNVIERTYNLETRVRIVEHEIEELSHK